MAFHIPYGAYARDALLGVVRRVLEEATRGGIHPPHHFYITFRTDHPETKVPDFLRESYPDQITIVLQHQFWDLRVNEYEFSVTLSFNGIQENLSIPFSGLTSFSDPSVKFGLQFLPDFVTRKTDPSPESSSPSTKGKKTPGKIVDLESFRKK
ncbi:MAG: ClpXP protease specificity-enhancing factor SspB [Holosporales bacterium]|jgi:hypothetical protein|nr:ClpXP protease specificity-enhancing factor SspB [Holosporales bacterium]